MSTPKFTPAEAAQIEGALKRHTQALFDAAFTDTTRTPRSPAYREGLRARLCLSIQKLAFVCPYDAGTAQFDAFYAGVDEGRAIVARDGQDGRDHHGFNLEARVIGEHFEPRPASGTTGAACCVHCGAPQLSQADGLPPVSKLPTPGGHQ